MLNVKPLLPVKRRNVNACLPVVDLGDMGKGIIHPAYSNISYRRVEKKSKTRKKNNFLASTGIVGRNNFELDRSINVNVGVPEKMGDSLSNYCIEFTSGLSETRVTVL